MFRKPNTSPIIVPNQRGTMSGEILETLGRRIRLHREAAKLSQQALAERAKISYKYLGTIERAQVSLSVEVLMKLARALDVEAGELLNQKAVEKENLSRAKFIIAELPERELVLAVEMLELLKQHAGDS